KSDSQMRLGHPGRRSQRQRPRAGCRFRGERGAALVAIGGDKADQSHRDQHDEGQKSDHCDVEKGHAHLPEAALKASLICCSLLLPLAQRCLLILKGSAGSGESFVVTSALTSSTLSVSRGERAG